MKKIFLFFCFALFLFSLMPLVSSSVFYSRGCYIDVEGEQTRSTITWGSCGRYELGECHNDDLIVGMAEADPYMCPAHDGDCIYFVNDNDDECNDDYDACDTDFDCSPGYFCRESVFGNSCEREEDEDYCSDDYDCNRGYVCDYDHDCTRLSCELPLVLSNDGHSCDFGDETECVTNNDCEDDERCDSNTYMCVSRDQSVGRPIQTEGQLCHLNPDEAFEEYGESVAVCVSGLNCVDPYELFDECVWTGDTALKLGVCSNACVFGYKLPSESCTEVACRTSPWDKGGYGNVNHLDECLSTCDYATSGLFGLTGFLTGGSNACSDMCYEQYGTETQNFFHGIENFGFLIIIVVGLILLVRVFPIIFANPWVLLIVVVVVFVLLKGLL